jgi:hypothetical protein
MDNTNNVNELKKEEPNKRGKPAVFTDSEFMGCAEGANSVKDIVCSLMELGRSFDGIRKERFDKWSEGKSDNQLRLFVSLRLTALRGKGFVIDAFKRGPKSKHGVKEFLEQIEKEAAEESATDVDVAVAQLSE